MNIRIPAIVFSCAMAFSGCHSYRVAGSGSDSHAPSQQVKGRYCLRTIKFDVDVPRHLIYGGPMANPHVPVQVASQMDDTRIKEFCEKRFSDVFTSDDSAVALDVIVTSRSPRDSYSWTFFFPYFLTLGILPGGIDVESDARFNVKIGNRNLISREASYAVDRKVSCFTPFGAIPFSRNSAYAYVETDEEVSFPLSPKTLEAMCESVFCKTFADTIVECLREHERRNGVSALDPAVKTSNRDSVSKTVEGLMKLRSEGVISEDEFNKMTLKAVKQTK